MKKLTPREEEVLICVLSGKTNMTIAKELIISPNTAKAHIGHILSKMKAKNRTTLALKSHLYLSSDIINNILKEVDKEYEKIVYKVNP